MAAQKQHHFLDRFLCCPGPLDHAGAPFANAGHFNEASAGLFNDFQRLQAEVLHDAFGSDRADAFDEPTAQVFLQAGEGGWFGLLCMEH